MKEWDEAVEAYTDYTSEDKLKIFLKVKMRTKEGLTQPFKDYCQAAIESVSRKDSEVSIDLEGCAGCFLSLPYTRITKEELLSAKPSYQGAALVIAGNWKLVRNYATLYVHICFSVKIKHLVYDYTCDVGSKPCFLISFR